MKKIVLTVLMAIATVATLRAQDDLYVIEQAFPVAISQLTVVEGWTVKTIYTPGEDSTRIAIVTPCPYYFAEGKEPAIFRLDGDKLHILTNRTMPQGTLIEVRYPKPLDAVIATGFVQLDTLHMLLRSKGPRAAAVMSAGRNSTLKINCLVSDGDIGVECREEGSKVEIGIVRCRQLLVDERQQQRVKTARMEADSLVVVPHHWWNDINWYLNTIIIDGKIGVAGLMSSESSPYSTSMMASFNILGRWLEIPMPNRWRFEAQFGIGFNFQKLSYDVLFDDDRLVFNPNNTVDHPITIMGQTYLALPLKLQYRPKNRKVRVFSNHLDLHLTPMLSFADQIDRFSSGTYYSKKANLHSRFQLRLGLSNTCLASVRGDVVSGGITWEVFVDLLPTYRPSAGAKGLHQIGFALHF